jgi:hypothetical protein
LCDQWNHAGIPAVFDISTGKIYLAPTATILFVSFQSLASWLSPDFVEVHVLLTGAQVSPPHSALQMVS